MSDRFSDRDATRAALSALVDGEATSPEVARACAAWRDEPDAVAAWHDYQMIGDVMRSEDLARASDGEAFLSKFRERLAQEPVVLSPSSAQAVRGVAHEAAAPAVVHALKRRAWAGPMSVAAGFLLVVGALMSSQVGLMGNGLGSGDASVAQSSGGLMASQGGMTSAYMPAQWNSNGMSAEATRMPGLSIGSGASFNRPGDVVIVRDPRLDQALDVVHPGQPVEATFAGQGNLIRQVVFEGR